VPPADQDRTLSDEEQIAALYRELARLTDSPAVELNRAVALSEAEGPEAGLALAERRLFERRLAELDCSAPTSWRSSSPPRTAGAPARSTASG